MTGSAQQIIESIFHDVGISVGGSNTWDPKVRDRRFFPRVFSDGSLGLGESYMLGWWDCEDLFQFFSRLLSHRNLDGRRYVGWRTALAYVKAKWTNVHTRDQSRELADKHYNLGNELFEHMLGPSMAYSCAYWRNAASLDDAQRAKFDLVCRKLHLRPGERLLDIGCGWGGLAKHAVENYGVTYVGITVSGEQADYARRYCDGLPVEIACCDYREFDPTDFGGVFDKSVSIGMVEHVGHRNYGILFESVANAMRDRGLFLLHTIGNDETKKTGDPWVGTYIFPEGMLPSMLQLSEAAEGHFNYHDLHNIGPHYTNTLLAWDRNFQAYWGRNDLREERPAIWGSHDTFYRMWRYYLQACAAAFNVGETHVWQIVFAKGRLTDTYETAR